MIAQLFWPKEMRELVKQYRAEGKLNEDAVKHFNFNINKSFVIGAILAILFGYFEGYKIGLAIVFLSPFAVYLDSYCLFRRCLASYSVGSRKKIIVISFEKGLYNGGMFGGQFMRYYFASDKQQSMHAISFVDNGVFSGRREIPKSGDEMFIFITEESKFKAMPDVDYIKRKYCLNAELLGEAT